eukprot:3725980-Amphidinium_carterae.2
MDSASMRSNKVIALFGSSRSIAQGRLVIYLKESPKFLTQVASFRVLFPATELCAMCQNLLLKGVETIQLTRHVHKSATLQQLMP